MAAASTFGEFQRAQAGYRAIFREARGPGPYLCGLLCQHGGMIYPDDDPPKAQRLVIHHADGDHENNDPVNLVATHHGCHSAHHARARLADGAHNFQDPEVRRKGAHGARKGSAAFAERLRTDPAFAATFAVKMRENGRKGGVVRTERLRNDPEFAAARSASSREGALTTNALRYRCNDCGKVASPGGIGLHQKASGHTGRERLPE